MKERERNVLFNDALNTFYLRLYGVRHMVKDHSDSEKGNPLRHIGYSYRLTARVILYAPSHRQDNTYHGLCYTSRGALAGTSTHERHIGSQWKVSLRVWSARAATQAMQRLLVNPVSLRIVFWEIAFHSWCSALSSSLRSVICGRLELTKIIPKMLERDVAQR